LQAALARAYYPREPTDFLKLPVETTPWDHLEWRIFMNMLASKVRRFLVSEDGPTAVEYAVMLALIIVVCLASIGLIGTKANTTFTSVNAKLG
jgi:pilus assembly protein Flp/PilA